MTRTSLSRLLCLCLTVSSLLMSSALWAQNQEQGGRRGRGGFGGGGFGGGGFGGGGGLLRNEQIQKELSITDEQKTKIQAVYDEARAARGDAGRGGDFRSMSEEERTKLFAERQKQSEETSKKAEALLNADQAKRYKEISIQLRGVSALTDAEVAKELKLSDDQVNTLKLINDELSKQRREMFAGGRGNGVADQSREDRMKAFEAMRTKMQTMQKDADDESLAVLTADQRSQFEKLKGTKFELDLSQFRRGGRGRDGGNSTEKKAEDKKAE